MPDWKGYLRERLSLPQMKGHWEERMISELADHLEDVYREALAGGASEEEARARAEEWLGEADVAAGELIRGEPAHRRAQANRWAEGREESLRGKGSRWVVAADVARDLRFALRALAKHPLFSGVAILVLALGIGASTSIFTLVDAIVLSPLPFESADRLVAVGHSSADLSFERAGQMAAAHFTYEEENRVFQDIGMYGEGLATVTGAGDPEAVPSLWITGGVLRALRTKPILGRSFIPEDEELESPSVALLGQGYWRTRFGADPGVIGRTLQVDGETVEIVGVMPSSLRSLGHDPDLILPLRFNRSTLFVGNFGYEAVARLRDGVRLDQAVADLDRMWPLAFEKFPGRAVMDAETKVDFAPGVRPLKSYLVGSVADLLWVLLGGVCVVLLIACANVANLFLVRAEGKGTEMAVRAAMGASRSRIGWEYLKETLLLGVLGGVGGLAIAYAGLEVLVAVGPAQLPRLEEVSLSPEALLFTLFISLSAGAFFGMIPVLRERGGNLVGALKEGGRGGAQGRSRHRAQNALAVSQMALALVLLVASGLMIRSFFALRNVDPGFHNPAEVQALRLYISGNDIPDPEDVARTHELIARRLAEIPGVTSVGLASFIPMDGRRNFNSLYADGGPPFGNEMAPTRRHKWIGEDYLETLQIPLLTGRTLTWRDVGNRLPVALVSESLARETWGSVEAALGQRISARPEPVRWHEVVGVVADVREDGMDQDPIPVVYWPQVTLAFWEGSAADQVQTWRGVGYAIRSSRVGTTGFQRDVREAIWEVNPNLPLLGLRTLPELMAQSMARTSFTLVLLGISGGVALILGIIGVYGVISYAVSQRSRELGVRLALGAQAHQVKAMVLRQGLVLSMVGVTIGLGLGLGLTRLMAGLLFGVSPMDPVTFMSVAAGLTVVALVASYLPARRAAAVDPMSALRAE
jgi:predicted permease